MRDEHLWGIYVLKLIKRGMPRASAQCMCAKVGGFEMIASAAKVLPVSVQGE